MADAQENPLTKEFDWYIKHQEELVKAYNGKFVAIKGGKVLAAFDDLAVAVQETAKTHPLGTFLVQKVTPGTEAYTQTYHSRVAFSSSSR